MWRLSRGVSTQRVAGRRFKATSGADVELVKRVRDAAIQHITAKGPVPVWSDCEAVLKLATAQLATRANVQSVSKAECPEAKGVQVWGDVHGQGKDFLHIMNALTPPTATAPSLFNGDLVDRGPNGSEIVLLLATYIVECPTSVWINRGNHEVPDCYHRYGFAHEILGKYGAETKAGLTLRSFQDFFNATSMAHVVDNSIFVVHGGPPKDRTTTIATLNAANRFEDDPGHPFHLMLWSDPDETEGQRGAVFSRTDVKRFLDANKLKFLIRSHEVMQNGYQVHHKGLSATVFSAPAYCGRMTNKAAVAWCEFNGSGVAKFEQFDHAKPGRS